MNPESYGTMVFVEGLEKDIEDVTEDVVYVMLVTLFGSKILDSSSHHLDRPTLIDQRIDDALLK